MTMTIMTTMIVTTINIDHIEMERADDGDTLSVCSLFCRNPLEN